MMHVCFLGGLGLLKFWREKVRETSGTFVGIVLSHWDLFKEIHWQIYWFCGLGSQFDATQNEFCDATWPLNPHFKRNCLCQEEQNTTSLLHHGQNWIKIAVYLKIVAHWPEYAYVIDSNLYIKCHNSECTCWYIWKCISWCVLKPSCFLLSNHSSTCFLVLCYVFIYYVIMKSLTHRRY